MRKVAIKFRELTEFQSWVGVKKLNSKETLQVLPPFESCFEFFVYVISAFKRIEKEKNNVHKMSEITTYFSAIFKC